MSRIPPPHPSPDVGATTPGAGRRRALRLLLGVAACVTGLALPAPLALTAQTRDPVKDAQAMFANRQSAAATAAMLRRDHARTLDQSASILRTVGFTVTTLVTALRTEFSATLSALHTSLIRAGFESGAVSDAFRSNGILLDCFDMRGTPVPCGGFGGTSDAPVTGQVSWHPKPEGQTGQQLYIEASNLPPVSVRIGSVTLQQENASSSAVVVRLPTYPLIGDLTLVRKSDGVSGLVQEDYRVVAPPLPWSGYASVAAAGAIADMKQWMQGARIAGGCTVNAPLAVGVPGSLSSATGSGGALRANLLAAGATSALADAWDLAFRTAFLNYTSLATIPSLPIFPGLVAVGAKEALPVGALPFPLAGMVSVGAVSMQSAALASSVSAAIANVSPNDPERAGATASFAAVVAGKFTLLLAKAMVMNLQGGGPVPGFAPPAVPVAPVIGGTCSGAAVVHVPPEVW